MNKSFKKSLSGLLAFSTLALSGCLLQPPQMRHEVADRVAHPAWMVGREIPAAPFSLKAYERIHDRGGTANLYIEGDGELEYESDNPTPKNPVALHLASKDKSKNLIYIARPCHYSGMIEKSEKCDPAQWRERRYAPEVARAYGVAMDEIKRRYDISAFNLVGFDGGAAIAADLAASRKDILSLRTVAGRLDRIGSPRVLSNVPQRHLIGGQDEDVPPAILHAYMEKISPTSCADYSFIQEASHMEGWVSKWPELLKEPVACEGPAEEFDALDLLPEPVKTTREVPEKP